MSGTERKDQKADRVRRVLSVARRRIPREGYDTVTIESLAAEVGVSPATVYADFGTKAGLLLGLVRESDQRLVLRLEGLADAPPPNLREGLARYGQTVRWHCLTWLSKATWRQVMAAAVLEGSGEFGRVYRSLDATLERLLARLLDVYRARGGLPPGIEPAALAAPLFCIINRRFVEFIADDALTDAEADRLLRGDIDALLAMCGSLD